MWDCGNPLFLRQDRKSAPYVETGMVLYYYLRMTDPQIAAVLDVGKTTVHRRRHEAIKKLHILLEDEK